MKILITGHTGFIGSHLSKYFYQKGNYVIGLSKSKSHNKFLEEEICIDLENVSDEQINKFKIKSKVSKIDVLINSSFKLATSENKASLDFFYQNIKITENIVKICKKIKPKKIINLSSIAVYPNLSDIFSETSQTKMSQNSECLYGLSKFCSENLLDFFLSENSKILHLRLAQVIGRGMRNDRIYSIMVSELKRSNKITVLGDGKRVSNFIKIEKLCNYINKFVNSKNIKGVFNIGDRNLNYKELASEIIKEYGNQNSIIKIKKEGVQSEFILDLNKLRNFLKR